jgi:putative transposase
VSKPCADGGADRRDQLSRDCCDRAGQAGRASAPAGALGAARSAFPLSAIYTAKDADQAQAELEAFDEKWGERFPVITQAWLDAWEHVIPFLAFPPQVRRVIYTTNAIEALNRQLRKAIKTKGSFPNEDAARKLVYLAPQNAVPQWTRTRNWTTALLAFKIHFSDRVPDTAN